MEGASWREARPLEVDEYGAMGPLFRDRIDAGRRLAAALPPTWVRPDAVVLGLPRGGVVVAAEVARWHGLPLDVFVVRKLGVPGQEELAMGAIASGDVVVENEEVIRLLGIPPQVVAAVAAREREEVRRRERLYRGDAPPLDLRGRSVILVDDGLATGSTMRAAIRAARARAAGPVYVAVPVGAADSCAVVGAEADDALCLFTPEPFHAVGLWYGRFDQVGDDEVRALLVAARTPEANR